MIGEVLSAAAGLAIGVGLSAAVLLRRERAAANLLAARLDAAAAAAVTLADMRSHLSGLRHDLRGILSPALLVADRLVNHEEAGVRRAGEVMIRTVDRAVARLLETPIDQEPENNAQL